MIDNPKAKRPAPHTGWTEMEPTVAKGYVLLPWQNGKICVISTIDLAELPRQNGVVGPQWHISISQYASPQNKRPTFEQTRKALRAFRMVGAEEDNHHPGWARHFFMPVDPSARVGCECKEDELMVTEKDGYAWSNAKSECRGCVFEVVTGKPCSIHAGDKAAEPR